MNFGIIGMGRIGKTHATSLSRFVNGATLVAVSDPFLDKNALTAWLNQAHITAKCVSQDEMFADPSIDVIMVCTPTPTHAELSIRALQAGKHVFCEKPVDMSPERILEIKKQVADSGKKLQIGFMQRFDHNFRALREAVASGRIGTPQTLHLTSRDPAPPPVEYIRTSGGIFADMMIHDIDLARYIMGCDVEEVYSAGTCMIDPQIGACGDADIAVVTMKMKNGALVVIENARAAAYGYDQRAELLCSKGMMQVENDRPNAVKTSTSEGMTATAPIGFFLERFMNAYTAELQAFVTAIETDTDVVVGVEDGYQDQLVALAATQSWKTGRPVKVTEG